MMNVSLVAVPSLFLLEGMEIEALVDGLVLVVRGLDAPSKEIFLNKGEKFQAKKGWLVNMYLKGDPMHTPRATIQFGGDQEYERRRPQGSSDEPLIPPGSMLEEFRNMPEVPEDE